MIALLQNNTIEIHDLYTQESVQVLSLASVGPTEPAHPATRPGPSALSPPSTPATPPAHNHSRAVSTSSSSATPFRSAQLTSPFSLPPSTPKSRLDAFQPRALVTCAAGFPDRAYTPGNSTSPAFSPLFVPLPPGASSSETVAVRLFPQQSLLDLPNKEAEVGHDLVEETQTGGYSVTAPASEPPSTPKASQPRKAESHTAPIASEHRATGRSQPGEALSLATTRSAGPAASNLTATRPKHLLRASASRTAPSPIVAANTLLLGRDSVFALCPVTLVVQADALIAGNRIDDALRLLQAVGKPDSAEKVRAVLMPATERSAFRMLMGVLD